MKIRWLLLDSTEYADAARYAELLPPSRRAKIARLRFDSDKLLSLAAGLLIRAEAGEGELALNAHGKPYFIGSDVHFSVSHSGRCAAIAVDSAAVGLDVEQLPQNDFMKLARRFYHVNELHFVEEAQDQPRAFARIWTRKEAYLKQLGIGISTDLRAFDTTADELSRRIASYDLDGYVLSVCAANHLSDESIDYSQIELKDLLK